MKIVGNLDFYEDETKKLNVTPEKLDSATVIRLVPLQQAPSNPEVGMIYYDATEGCLKVCTST